MGYFKISRVGVKSPPPLGLGGTVDAKNILVPRSVTVPDLVTVGLVSEISVEKKCKVFVPTNI